MGERASFGIYSTIAGFSVPILLALDVIFGGSVREAFVVTAVLEVLGCLVLIWCLFDAELRPLSRSALWLLGIIGFAGLICLLQLIPLPYAWWSRLPGRGPVSSAFTIAGIGSASQPLSLAPDRTIYGILRLLPLVAIFVLSAKLRWRALSVHLGWAIVLLATLSAALGLAQTLANTTTLLFPYGHEDRGKAAGLFEVVNHQATLQLMAIPFVAVLFGRAKAQFDLGDSYQAYAVVSVAALILLVMGVALSGSVAGYAITIPVLVVSCLLAFDGRPSPQLIAGGLIVGVGLAGLAYVVIGSPMLSGLGATDFGTGPLSRRAAFAGAIDMVGDYLPFGSGLGTFEGAYPGYENPATVTPNFISHVHNDYLEVAVELGIPGCIALAGVITWWVAMTVRAWRASREEGGRLKRAASVAAGVVIVHSLVDFPARTEAIGCLLALCMGVMSSGPKRGSQDKDATESPRTFMHRHLEI